jgi:hypothetical protein
MERTVKYSDADIQRAFLEDEVARYSLLLGAGPQRPNYSELELAAGVPGQPAGPVTFEDVDSAVAELSALRGEAYASTYAQVRSLAGGERDLDSLTAGVVELARSDSGTVELAATISAADRRALAAKGWALADGSYPIPDKSHLRAAAVLAASGHGNVKAARALIRKRAAELGVDLESLPGFGSGEDEGDEEENENERGRSMAAARRWARAGAVSLSAGDYELELASSVSEGGPVEDILRRYAGYFREGGMQRPGGARPRGRRQPFRPGRATTSSRAHSPDEEDASDRRQPHRGGAVHPEVERYLRELERASGAEKPHGSVQVHHPRAGRRAG